MKMSLEVFLTGLIAAGFRIATPILLAALGETFAERSGILNLGIEGMMIMSAFTSFSVTYDTGNPTLGLLAGLITGGVMAFIHAFMSITIKVDQIVSGLALTILGLALSTFLFISYFKRTQPAVEIWEPTAIPVLSQIPIIGPALFQQHVITYFAIILFIVSTWFLFGTTWGLTIRTVGENPAAADTVGIRVERVRYLCTIFGGLMAGIAGAYLTLVVFNSFFGGMTAGRGWIAIAVVIFGRWTPSWVFGGALFFGLVDSFQLRLQASGIPISPQFSLMIPYLFTLIALIIVGRKRYAPAALCIPYRRGER
ncbi:ABC transporter permease [Candidatus Hecatella orcuttiae]|uniref:ABC transporter permease n=1 Tax=Candidatus Hecatella orcuttiae TaxID=1935119 RepID=UPI002867EBB6|nr:ABC transporter permease [Candidatus Hecatella orcuttiae]